MFITYLRTSLRILWRNRFTTFINICGLSAGIASCLLIYMYVQNELSYDSHHEKKDRIYRVVSDLNIGEEEKSGMSSFALSSTIKQDYPEVEEAIRVMPVGKQTMWVDDRPFQFNDNLMSDTGFFELFDYDFILGDPATALKEPQSVVITDEVAGKMFGSPSDALGKMIRYARQSYKVTGVVKDVKNNSHLYFNTLLSINSLQPQFEATLRRDWFYLAQTNYILFKNETDTAGFEQKLAQIRDKYIVPWVQSLGSNAQVSFRLQSLTQIHLQTEYPASYAKTGNRSYIYIFSIVAIFILIIACINYINLATATASKRAKEIGIRKTAGANASGLFRQFISESLFMALLAIVFAMLLVHILLPFFNNLTDKFLSVPYSLSLGALLLFLLLFIGPVAGAYPAFYLSGLQPALVLKSNKIPGGFAAWLRNSLVVLQFFISVSFIICTIVVYSQMYFMKHADLGFNKDQMLVVTVPLPDTSFVSKYEVVRQELAQNSDILKIASTGSVPGVGSGALIHQIEFPDHRIQEKAIDYMMVSHDLIDMMGMKIVKGRNFSRDFSTDDTAAFIVNEAALKIYGWSDALNYTLENGFGYKGKIIGVVRDFHYKSLHQPIEPLVMMLDGRLQGYLLLKIKAGREAETVAFVEKVWKQYSRRYPMEYFFLDDNFDKLYRAEEKMMKVFTYFSIISIMISCLGLYALITFTLEQRIKEIGIRKVMGASIPNIVLVMSKDFVILVCIAVIIAFPVSWYFMNRWLQDFANRIDMSWWMFIAAAGVSITVAAVTLSVKTIRAAAANPITSLRYE
jgi:putative ABC transport system permease protein